MQKLTRIGATLFISATAALATGCANWLTVKSVQDHPNAKGFRYSLTAPYLLVTPASDGTLTYEWLSLPDTSRQYAVEVNSLFSLHTTQLTLNHAILEKIVANSDSSQVATEALSQAGTLLEAKRKEALKKKQDAETAAKEEQAALEKSLAEAEEAARAADVEVQKARAKVALLRGQNPPDKEKLFEAETALKIAEIDRDAARREVARIKGLMAAGSKSGANSANDGADPGANTVAEAATKKVWGPVLFRVVQTTSPPGVALRAVHAQTTYDTYGVAATNPPSGSPELKIDADWNAADKSLTLTTAGKFPETEPSRFNLRLGFEVFPTKMTVKPGADDKTVVVTFDPALKKGTYMLQLAFKSQEIAAAPREFSVP